MAPKQKTPIAEQDPKERCHNFKEVCLGYTLEEGIAEAKRCLQCKTAPCVKGCPVSIDIPGFIKAVAEGDMPKAAEIMGQYTNLPAVCGRVCPQESQCEGVCTLGKVPGFEPVAIGKLERLVAENPQYGHVVCRCESVSEAEIVEAIHKGHTTLDGIKFYTRAGMGRCQGGFCTYKILKIIARETGMPVEHITKRGDGSRIVQGHIPAPTTVEEEAHA